MNMHMIQDFLKTDGLPNGRIVFQLNHALPDGSHAVGLSFEWGIWESRPQLIGACSVIILPSVWDANTTYQRTVLAKLHADVVIEHKRLVAAHEARLSKARADLEHTQPGVRFNSKAPRSTY